MDGSVEKLEVTWQRVLTIWWSIAWRGFVFGVLSGVIVGAFWGLIAGLLGHADKAEKWGTLGGQIVSIPISMIVLKMVLEKKWKEFSIALISEQK